MKKAISLLLALICALALCAGNAAAEDGGIPEENPAETSTFAFPVSANRAVHVDNGDAKLIPGGDGTYPPRDLRGGQSCRNDLRKP